jgi:uncharacterized protein
MLQRAKSWIIRKLGGAVVIDAAPAAPVESPKRRGISHVALARMAEMTTASKQEFRKYVAPKLPPGVVPEADPVGLVLAHDEMPRSAMALDDGGSVAPAYTWLNQFNSFGCGLFFPGYPYLAELTQISEYRAPSETISTEMTRKWMEVTTEDEGDKSDKIKQINERMDELKVRELFTKAALLDGEFGRAQIILNIKNQTDDATRQLPFVVEEMKKGSLESLQVVEPYWSTPYSYNSTRPERPDFYVPQSWYMMGRKTHATRILTFIARPMPDLLKAAYNFSGISMSQLMEPYVNFWLRTRKSVNDLIHNFSVTILATDLATTLEDGADGSSLINRARLMTQNRDNQGLAMINKDSEEIVQVNTPLSGLDKLQAQAQEHMAAPCHIPLVKLFGVVPTGLNATSEGEIQVWYDFVRAMQENFFGPHMDVLLKVIQMDLFGAVDDTIKYHWVNLDEPTGKELSEIRASDATAGAAYISAGVISPDEERERLQSDPDSGYDNLTGNAPEPEQEVDPADLAGAGFEHEASESDKDREHDADQSAAQRAHELAVAKIKKPAAKA